jgi:membrane fusion protein, multidrug efflux system
MFEKENVMIKFFVTLGMTALFVFMVITLIGNKRKRDNELKARQEYTSIVPVETVCPRMVPAKKTVEENGVLRAGAEITVLSETTGKVLSVAADIGDRVVQGQVLANVENDIVESQYILAKINLENAEKNQERNNKLVRSEAITQQQLEMSTAVYQNAKTNYQALKKQLENTVIRSPVSGTIAKRSIEKGSSLLPSLSLFSIIEQDRMLFTVRMTETDLAAIKRSMHAAIRFDALPQDDFSGSVRSIGVVPDLSGRYDVDLVIGNGNRQLRAGMGGTALFDIPITDSVLTIPRKCIVGSIRDAAVYIRHRDSVRLQSVTAEPLNETDVMIADGLSHLDTVVLSGQINLRNNAKVKVIH